MPGFGTSNRTKKNADAQLKMLGITGKEIDIRQQCVQMWKDMKHIPFSTTPICTEDGLNMHFVTYMSRKYTESVGENYRLGTIFNIQNLSVELLEECLNILPSNAHDLVFENVQARVRTSILMNHGFTLGTGDLSESALGWCTYNADHMSMYNVNCSIPKTLVKFLVKYIAEFEVDSTWKNEMEIRQSLLDVVDTPISPELLPTKNGEIQQETEDSIGPYELHDFFLYNFMRCGFTPSKILFLSKFAKFDKDYSIEEIGKWLKVFYSRFFTQQFKRDCVPDGPKVGSVSLPPRGDWRMPPDADRNPWLNEVDTWMETHGENDA